MKTKNNHIEIYKNAMTDQVCDDIIEVYNNSAELQIPGRTQNGLNEGLKKSTDMNLLSAREHNEKVESTILPAIKLAIRKCLYKYTTKYQLMGTTYDPKDYSETEWVDLVYSQLAIWPGAVSIKKYNKGDGHYGWHQDMGGNMLAFARQLVIQFYLNDVEEGGETGFYHQDVEYKPEKGAILIFPAGFTHYHRGKKPISGEKYIMNMWLLHRIPPVNVALDKMVESNKHGW